MKGISNVLSKGSSSGGGSSSFENRPSPSGSLKTLGKSNGLPPNSGGEGSSGMRGTGSSGGGSSSNSSSSHNNSNSNSFDSGDGDGEDTMIVKREGVLVTDLLYRLHRRSTKLVDLHVICSDGYIPVHRCVLMACSDFIFKLLIQEDPAELAAICLPDFKVSQVMPLIHSFYSGCTIFAQSDLNTTLELISLLQANPAYNFHPAKEQDKKWAPKMRHYLENKEGQQQQQGNNNGSSHTASAHHHHHHDQASTSASITKRKSPPKSSVSTGENNKSRESFNDELSPASGAEENSIIEVDIEEIDDPEFPSEFNEEDSDDDIKILEILSGEPVITDATADDIDIRMNNNSIIKNRNRGSRAHTVFPVPTLVNLSEEAQSEEDAYDDYDDVFSPTDIDLANNVIVRQEAGTRSGDDENSNERDPLDLDNIVGDKDMEGASSYQARSFEFETIAFDESGQHKQIAQIITAPVPLTRTDPKTPLRKRNKKGRKGRVNRKRPSAATLARKRPQPLLQQALRDPRDKTPYPTVEENILGVATPPHLRRKSMDKMEEQKKRMEDIRFSQQLQLSFEPPSTSTIAAAAATSSKAKAKRVGANELRALQVVDLISTDLQRDLRQRSKEKQAQLESEEALICQFAEEKRLREEEARKLEAERQKAREKEIQRKQEEEVAKRLEEERLKQVERLRIQEARKQEEEERLKRKEDEQQRLKSEEKKRLHEQRLRDDELRKKALEEEGKKRRQTEEEAQKLKLVEEKRKQEEAQEKIRLEAQSRRSEEEIRVDEDERRRKEERRREKEVRRQKADEQKKAEEEEKRKIEESLKSENEQRTAEEKRKAEELYKAEEEKLRSEEKRKADEVKRVAEEKRKSEEEKQKAAEEKLRLEEEAHTMAEKQRREEEEQRLQAERDARDKEESEQLRQEEEIRLSLLKAQQLFLDDQRRLKEKEEAERLEQERLVREEEERKKREEQEKIDAERRQREKLEEQQRVEEELNSLDLQIERDFSKFEYQPSNLGVPEPKKRSEDPHHSQQPKSTPFFENFVRRKQKLEEEKRRKQEEEERRKRAIAQSRDGDAPFIHPGYTTVPAPDSPDKEKSRDSSEYTDDQLSNDAHMDSQPITPPEPLPLDALEEASPPVPEASVPVCEEVEIPVEGTTLDLSMEAQSQPVYEFCDDIPVPETEIELGGNVECETEVETVAEVEVETTTEEAEVVEVPAAAIASEAEIVEETTSTKSSEEVGINDMETQLMPTTEPLPKTAGGGTEEVALAAGDSSVLDEDLAVSPPTPDLLIVDERIVNQTPRSRLKKKKNRKVREKHTQVKPQMISPSAAGAKKDCVIVRTIEASRRSSRSSDSTSSRGRFSPEPVTLKAATRALIKYPHKPVKAIIGSQNFVIQNPNITTQRLSSKKYEVYLAKLGRYSKARNGSPPPPELKAFGSAAAGGPSISKERPTASHWKIVQKNISNPKSEPYRSQARRENSSSFDDGAPPRLEPQLPAGTKQPKRPNAPAPMENFVAVTKPAYISDHDLEWYQKELKRCAHCKKRFDRHTKATDCLQGHGFKRCLICLDLVPAGDTSYELHYSRHHSVPKHRGYVACPICGKFVMFRGLPNHVTRKHLNPPEASAPALTKAAPDFAQINLPQNFFYPPPPAPQQHYQHPQLQQYSDPNWDKSLPKRHEPLVEPLVLDLKRIKNKDHRRRASDSVRLSEESTDEDLDAERASRMQNGGLTGSVLKENTNTEKEINPSAFYAFKEQTNREIPIELIPNTNALIIDAALAQRAFPQQIQAEPVQAPSPQVTPPHPPPPPPPPAVSVIESMPSVPSQLTITPVMERAPQMPERAPPMESSVINERQPLPSERVMINERELSQQHMEPERVQAQIVAHPQPLKRTNQDYVDIQQPRKKHNYYYGDYGEYNRQREESDLQMARLPAYYPMQPPAAPSTHISNHHHDFFHQRPSPSAMHHHAQTYLQSPHPHMYPHLPHHPQAPSHPLTNQDLDNEGFPLINPGITVDESSGNVLCELMPVNYHSSPIPLQQAYHSNGPKGPSATPAPMQDVLYDNSSSAMGLSRPAPSIFATPPPNSNNNNNSSAGSYQDLSIHDGSGRRHHHHHHHHHHGGHHSSSSSSSSAAVSSSNHHHQSLHQQWEAAQQAAQQAAHHHNVHHRQDNVLNIHMDYMKLADMSSNDGSVQCERCREKFYSHESLNNHRCYGQM